MSEASQRTRAVAVVIRDGRVLLIRRRRTGVAEYHVIPGGGVEPGESPAASVVRELHEETGLDAVRVEPLWVLSHDSGDAHYFRVVDGGGEPAIGGPEAVRQSPDNTYRLEWTSPDELGGLNLQPAEIRARLLSLLAPYAP